MGQQHSSLKYLRASLSSFFPLKSPRKNRGQGRRLKGIPVDVVGMQVLIAVIVGKTENPASFPGPQVLKDLSLFRRGSKLEDRKLVLDLRSYADTKYRSSSCQGGVKTLIQGQLQKKSVNLNIVSRNPTEIQREK